MTDKSLASSADTSPDALLKQAILGARAAAEKSAAVPAKTARRLDPRLAGIIAASLGLGALIGAGATALTGSRPGETGEALTQMRHQVEALAWNPSVRRSARQRSRAGPGGSGRRAVRGKSRGTTLAERIGRSEQSLATKITTMGDRLEQADKELSARFASLTAQVEKRGAAPASAPPARRRPSLRGPSRLKPERFPTSRRP